MIAKTGSIIVTEDHNSEHISPSSSKIMMDNLLELNGYFCRMIDTIPARVYFIKNEEIIQDMDEQKYSVENSESSLSIKAQQKRARLSLDSHTKVSDIAAQYFEKKQSNNKMNELRKKLAKRIKEMKGNRPATSNGVRDTRVGVKRSVQDSCDLNNNSKNKTNQESQPEPGPSNDNKKRKKVKASDDGDDAEEGTLPQFVFSKFDFARQTDLAAEEKLNKNKQTKTSLKKQLAHAEREERVLQELASRDPATASRIKMEKMWNSALERAEGNKSRDDTKKLSKKIKQKDRKKVKSAKEWKDRADSVVARKDKKQAKRTKNIEARKTQKKDKKIKILKKRGRILD